jgi:hypothetical protein
MTCQPEERPRHAGRIDGIEKQVDCPRVSGVPEFISGQYPGTFLHLLPSRTILAAAELPPLNCRMMGMMGEPAEQSVR